MGNSKTKSLLIMLGAFVFAFLCALSFKQVKATWYAPSNNNINVWSSNVSYVAKKVNFKSVSVDGGNSASGEIYVSSSKSVYATHSSYLQFQVGGRSSSHGFETGQLWYGSSANSTSTKILSSCPGNKSSYKTMYINFYFNYGSSTSATSSVSCSKSSDTINYYISPNDTKNYIGKWFTYEAGFDWYDNDFKFTFKINGDSGVPTIDHAGYPYAYDGTKWYYVPSGYIGSHTEVNMTDTASGAGMIYVNGQYAFSPWPITESACGSSCTLRFYDKVGNYTSRTYYLDKTGPSMTDTKSYNGSNGTWYTPGSTTVTFSDGGSGYSSYQIDNETYGYDSSITLTSSNCGSSCTVYAYDSLGNATSKTYYADTSVPTINGGVYSNSKYWYKPGSTKLTLDDGNTSDSGFNYFKIGNTTYGGKTITLSASNCGNSCTVTAYDNVGKTTTRTYYKDETSPQMDGGVYSNGKYWYKPDETKVYFDDKATGSVQSGFYFHRINDGGTTYANPVTLTTGNCGNSCTVTAYDYVGNSYSRTYYMDYELDTYEVSGDSTTWTANDRTIRIYGTDSKSGIDAYYCQGVWFESTSTSYGCKFTTSTKTSIVGFRDKAGNYIQEVVNVYVDKGDPTVTPKGESTTWTSADRTIKIQGADSYSGVSAYYCQGVWIDSTATSYDCVFTTTTTTSTVGVADKVGHTSTKTVNVYVDKNIPIATFEGSRDSYSADSQTITIANASDDYSGLPTNAYCIQASSSYDDCSWSAESSRTFNTTTNNTYYMFVRNNVGNVLESGAVYVKVDKTKPTATFNYPTAEWHNEDITLSIDNASDANAGLAENAYCIQQNSNAGSCSWSSEASLELNTTMEVTYYMFVKDSVENVLSSGAITIKLDKEAPTYTAAGKFSGTYFKGSLALSFADATSGFFCYSTSNTSCSSETSNQITISETTTIYWKDVAGNYTIETFTYDDVAPVITISKHPDDISTDAYNQYLTITPIISIVDSGAGVPENYKGIINRCSFVLTVEGGCTGDVSGEANPFKSGYQYWINAADNLGNKTEQGKGAKMFYLLITDSEDPNATTLVSVFNASTSVTTLAANGSEAPGLTFNDTMSANYLALLTNAFQYMKILAYSEGSEITAEQFEMYATIITISDFITTTVVDGNAILTVTTLSTAAGQTGARKLAYQFCSDKGCTNATGITKRGQDGSTGSVTNVASQHVKAKAKEDSLLVKPVIMSSIKTNNSTSRWIFVSIIVVITLVAIELILGSKLRKRTRLF